MVTVIYAKEEKVPIYNVNGEKIGEKQLPEVFFTPIRLDLIKRAFLAEFTAKLQPKGRDPMAGKRTSARSLGVGRGLARVPRIRGTSRAALANSTVGGRLAHPPRIEKKIHGLINKKEKKLATASAIAATASQLFVEKRGHIYKAEKLPIVIESSVLNSITKAKEARSFLEKIGVLNDIIRAAERWRVRAGRGKMRGRRYIKPKSVLFVVESKSTPFTRALRNFPGVDVVTASRVSVLDLAPGGVPGRLTVYTDGALEMLRKRFEGKLVVLKQ
jgi:large subunit ribosomal protein L4e